AFLALPMLFVAARASADECTTNADCGFGFSCETIVTSAISTGTGGIGGTGAGGAAGYAAASGSAGTGFGGAATGGTSSGAAPGGSGGVGSAPPPPAVCGNYYCETPLESPVTCPSDCVYTTVCAPATCSDDAQCAPGYSCPAPGSVGTGGGPNVAFCGDMLCS